MSIAHTWSAAAPGQPCQARNCNAPGVWLLTITGNIAPEVYCDRCAPPAELRVFGLTSPHDSTDPRGCASSPPASEASARHAGAEANPSPEVKTVLTSPQTREAADGDTSAASEHTTLIGSMDE